MAGFQIKRCPDVVEAAAAARFIGARVALLRSAANDLGPGAGDRGGSIVGEGTPEEIAGMDHSLTGVHLRPFIGNGRKRRG